MVEPRLGVDFGRVIQGGGPSVACPRTPGTRDDDAAPTEPEDTVFLSGDMESAMRSPPTEGAFDVLPRLVARFGGRVWVISKCGERIQRRTLQWLDHHDFYRRTGIPRWNVRFCGRRADKAIHCAELGITHMIDDRLDVHAALRGLVPFRYLFGPQDAPPPDWVVHTPSWADVDRALASVGGDAVRHA
jgi:hypothetical protein